MRDLYLRFSRSRRPPEPTEPDPTAFEAQVRDAFPRPAVSDALQSRVAEICRTAAAPESQAQGQAARKRRLWVGIARWGTLGLGAAALIAFILAPPWTGAREVASWSLAGRGQAMLQAQREKPRIAMSPGPSGGRLSEVDAVGKALPGSPVAVSRRAHRPASQDADERFLASIPDGDVPTSTDGEPAAKPKPLGALQDSRPDRYLIRNATLTLEVRDARHASRMLMAAVGAARGYVAESHESVDELGQRSVVITVRVPAGRFDGSLAQIEALGKVLDKQVTAEDVTEEFVDSQARLANLQQTEQRLRAHLSQTGRLSDILLVERELTRVRGQIEQLQGRLRYLSHRIAYSTLAVTLNEAPRPQPVVPPQGFSSGKVTSDAMRSLVAFTQTLWSGAIWIAVWAVVWAPLALAAWVVYRRRVGDVIW